jgi:hypothetical protein
MTDMKMLKSSQMKPAREQAVLWPVHAAGRTPHRLNNSLLNFLLKTRPFQRAKHFELFSKFTWAH